jgi:hypothetical protein
MKSINLFKANIENLGTVHQNKFDVLIPGLYSKDLSLRCESVNFPGIQILTADFKLFGGQPITKIPTGRINDEVMMTFLTTGDMRDKYFFEEWLHKISDFESNNVAYYDDVAIDIWITFYNETIKAKIDSTFDPGKMPEDYDLRRTGSFGGGKYEFREIYTARLVKAIPTRVEMIQVSWADTDQLLKYTVNFSYESLKIESYSNVSGKSFSHLDKVQK